jgi:hypothetical protein
VILRKRHLRDFVARLCHEHLKGSPERIKAAYPGELEHPREVPPKLTKYSDGSQVRPQLLTRSGTILNMTRLGGMTRPPHSAERRGYLA